MDSGLAHRLHSGHLIRRESVPGRVGRIRAPTHDARNTGGTEQDYGDAGDQRRQYPARRSGAVEIRELAG
jgi:hypothetical protein